MQTTEERSESSDTQDSRDERQGGDAGNAAVGRRHEDDFWREHERCRLQRGLSARAYAAAAGLSYYTFRHRVRQLSPAASAVGVGTKKGVDRRGQFIAVGAGAASRADAGAAGRSTGIEVLAGGLTLRLHGEAGERVLAEVLVRLSCS